MEKRNKLLTVAIVTGVAITAGFALWQVYRRRKLFRCSLRHRRPHQEIHVISSIVELKTHLGKFTDQLKILKVMGFDCEWIQEPTTNKRRRVALLQMATPSGLCLLVRLCHMGNEVPPELLEILKDTSILKVGVAVEADGKKLMKDYGLFVQGCVDLRHLLARVRNTYKCQLSLQGLAQGVLGVALDKTRDVRCSNWETDTFSTEQIEYAAADAQVGVDIFVKLALTKLLGVDSKDLVWSLDRVDLHELWRTARAVTQGIVDTRFKESKLSRTSQSQTSKSSNNKKCDESERAYSARSRPLYTNCQLQAPDGQPLCTCDVRKAEWYIEKELGDKVCDDPLTVRLRFEPSGRPESENNYYLQDKENVCVVCGRADTYTRKFVVPQEYRKYFPNLLKDHRSHDILLLCPPCHQVSSNHDAVLRQRLADECDAPIDTGTGCRSTQDEDRMRIRSAAKALKLSRDQIPEKRVKQLEKILLDFFNIDTITEDILDDCTNMDTRIFNQEYLPHGKKVVEYYKQHGQLWEFERKWRIHFIETMKPKHLPPLWSVDHHHNGVLSTH